MGNWNRGWCEPRIFFPWGFVACQILILCWNLSSCFCSCSSGLKPNKIIFSLPACSSLPMSVDFHWLCVTQGTYMLSLCLKWGKIRVWWILQMALGPMPGKSHIGHFAASRRPKMWPKTSKTAEEYRTVLSNKWMRERNKVIKCSSFGQR